MMLLFWLFTKHLVVDFFLQPPYMYKNKGTYGHLGGLLHAGLHAIATGLLLYCLGYLSLICLGLALLDGLLHYHIDWSKVKLNTKYGWGPLTSEKYWWLLGLDQYAHCLTYLLIAYLLGV